MQIPVEVLAVILPIPLALLTGIVLRIIQEIRYRRMSPEDRLKRDMRRVKIPFRFPIGSFYPGDTMITDEEARPIGKGSEIEKRELSRVTGKRKKKHKDRKGYKKPETF